MITPNAAANLVDDCYETCSERLPSKLEDIIKQIQLDAMKEGARRAINIVNNHKCDDYYHDYCGCQAAGIAAANAAQEQWKEKDL